MKKIILLGVLVWAVSCQSSSDKNRMMEEKETVVEIEEVKVIKPDSVLRHVVYFSFQESSSAGDIQKVVDAFRNLQDEIPEIKSFEWGENSSPEGLNRGLTHAFTLTFHSDADRDAYLPHPAHQAFGTLLTPHLKEVLVVDYWTRD